MSLTIPINHNFNHGGSSNHSNENCEGHCGEVICEKSVWSRVNLLLVMREILVNILMLIVACSLVHPGLAKQGVSVIFLDAA